MRYILSVRKLRVREYWKQSLDRYRRGRRDRLDFQHQLHGYAQALTHIQLQALKDNAIQ